MTYFNYPTTALLPVPSTSNDLLRYSYSTTSNSNSNKSSNSTPNSTPTPTPTRLPSISSLLTIPDFTSTSPSSPPPLLRHSFTSDSYSSLDTFSRSNSITTTSLDTVTAATTPPTTTTTSTPTSATTTSHTSIPKKKRSNLPKQSTNILFQWLLANLDHPYPNSREKADLIRKTGLTSQQLSNWFINARRRKINSLKEKNHNHF